MTRDEMLIHLERWMVAHDRLESKWDDLARALGMPMVESSLWDASWAMFEAYTATLGDLIGDPGPNRWLEWHCTQNDMGIKGLEAGYDDNLRPIETLEDLADLIIEGRQRA